MVFSRIAGAACRVALACGLCGGMAAAQAHPSPSSEVLLSVGAATVTAEVTLPVDELKLAYPEQLVDDTGHWAATSDARLAAYLVAHIRPVAPDGRAWSVKVDRVRWELGRTPADVVASMSLRPPPGAPLGSFGLDVDTIAHQVPNHNTLVAVRSPGAGARPHMLASLYYGHRHLEVRDIAPHWWTGFGDMFRLGMRHIAEGADHLLFLLTLLLPAALRVERRRWGAFAGPRHLVRHLLVVVSAFTAGHSLTLALGATGLAVLPGPPVEAAIAISIVVAAAHAWRPILPHREGWIAAGFGLVHGLAFASALSEMQLAGARLAAAVLAFNLGIETVQALLVLLARTRHYQRFRQVAAVLAAGMALVWLAERVGVLVS